MTQDGALGVSFTGGRYDFAPIFFTSQLIATPAFPEGSLTCTLYVGPSDCATSPTSGGLSAYVNAMLGATGAGGVVGAVAGWVAGAVAGWVVGAVAGWVAGAVAGWVVGAVAGWVAGAVAGWVAGAVAGWVAGAVAGWVAGAVAGWVAGAVAGWVAGAVAGGVVGSVAAGFAPEPLAGVPGAAGALAPPAGGWPAAPSARETGGTVIPVGNTAGSKGESRPSREGMAGRTLGPGRPVTCRCSWPVDWPGG